MIRKALSLICAAGFFGATLVGILKGVSLGSCLSFTSGTAFLLGTLMDHRDIFRREANQESKD